MLWNGSACSYDSSVFSFLRNIRIVLYSGCAGLQPHDGVGGFLCALTGALLAPALPMPPQFPAVLAMVGDGNTYTMETGSALTDEGLSQSELVVKHSPLCYRLFIVCEARKTVPGTQRPLHAQ